MIVNVAEIVQQFERDANTAKQAVSEEKVIVPWQGKSFKSLPLVAKEAQQQASQAIEKVIEHGMVRGFVTEALLKAWKPNFDGARAKADDTKKIWRWELTSAAGATQITGNWVDTGLSELDQAKTYADQNKLDVKKINHSYQAGNMIGSKSARYLNFGLSSAFVISAATYYDSVVIPITVGDVLYLLNDKQIYTPSNGAAYAFFADDPYLNRSQARIIDNRSSSIVDQETGLSYIRVTVPEGANYLILNTRYNNAAGTVSHSFNWAIHSSAFNSSYDQGTEVITYIDDVKVPTVIEVEKLSVEKLDISEIETRYSEGNLIGPNSKRVLNFGLNDVRSLLESNVADSTIITVDANSLLFIYNDKNTISLQSRATFAFFAEDPSLNKTQSRIVHTETSKTDVVSGVAYREVKVPEGANYLILNHRVTLAATGTINYNWAVHKDSFVYSFEQGREYVSKIKNLPLVAVNFDENQTLISSKNIYTGEITQAISVFDNGTYLSSNANDTVSQLIPVEFGKTYTISGLSVAKVGGVIRVLGLETKATPSSGYVSLLAKSEANKFTITIDDVRVKFICFTLTRNNYGTVDDAKYMPVQVELGDKATPYQPNNYSDSLQRVINYVENQEVIASGLPVVLSQFTKLDSVRDSAATLGLVSSTVGPLGVSYKLKGSLDEDHTSNNLYASHRFSKDGNKAVNVNLMKFNKAGVKATGSLKRNLFTVPSGSIDNPNTFADSAKYPLYNNVHPSIAYTETPVGGFKYWMISSTYPPIADGNVLWEDEDLYVSNDAANWQRVRSMYETDKSYTTQTLRLPPQTLETVYARKNAFLPCPAAGATLEMSTPASNGLPAMDRQLVTLNGFPWKHDPCILIDGGYVYTYHSFNLKSEIFGASKGHFFVCVRTANGVDWEVIRTDGSTMLLTEESSRNLFTKDEQGRFNYLSFAYQDSRSNPEVIKYGTGDYELFWGTNFGKKYTGTTPYTFDFDTSLAVSDKGVPNHPTLQLFDDKLYLISGFGVYESSNRGVSWTLLPHYPMWLGGVGGISYKKSGCIGEGGKYIYIDTQRFLAQSFALSAFNYVNDINQLFVYEYASFSDFINKANEGLDDAYIDLQITRVNLTNQTREVLCLPYISATNVSGSGAGVLQRIKIADLKVEQGDMLYLNVTLNSRNGAEIVFGGIDIV